MKSKYKQGEEPRHLRHDDQNFEGVPEHGGILNNTPADTQAAPNGAVRHAHAGSDEQDISLDKAPSRKKTTGHRRRSTSRRPGRRRGPRSMGRHPFLTCMNRYLRDNKPYKAASTLKQEERTLRRIHGHFQKLKSEGKAQTTNPINITQEDVGSYILFLKSKGIDINTQAKYCQYLKNLLTWSGNLVMEVMSKKKLLPVENRNKEIISLTDGEVKVIIEAAQSRDGWSGTMMAFAIPMYYYTGLRTNELAKADISDLNTTKWMFTVMNPKGKESWGRKRTVPIVPPLRPYVLDYLKKRAKRVAEYGHIKTTYLIPNLSRYNCTGKPYKVQSFNRMKKMVEATAGINFEFRTLRRTFGQHLRDRGVPIDAVSKLLGHSTTNTTEKYYARIRDEHAFQLAEEAWSRLPIESTP